MARSVTQAIQKRWIVQVLAPCRLARIQSDGAAASAAAAPNRWVKLATGSRKPGRPTTSTMSRTGSKVSAGLVEGRLGEDQYRAPRDPLTSAPTHRMPTTKMTLFHFLVEDDASDHPAIVVGANSAA